MDKLLCMKAILLSILLLTNIVDSHSQTEKNNGNANYKYVNIIEYTDLMSKKHNISFNINQNLKNENIIINNNFFSTDNFINFSLKNYNKIIQYNKKNDIVKIEILEKDKKKLEGENKHLTPYIGSNEKNPSSVFKQEHEALNTNDSVSVIEEPVEPVEIPTKSIESVDIRPESIESADIHPSSVNSIDLGSETTSIVEPSPK